MQKNPFDDYIDLLTSKGSIKQIEQCIKSHPEIKTNTPFIYAVHANRLDVIKLLIKLRVPINAQDKYQRTALHYAVAFNREPIIELLVNAGATLIPDKDGKTPLDIAISDPESKALAFFKQHIDAAKQNDITINKILSHIHDLDVAGLTWIVQDDVLLELLPKDIATRHQELLKTDLHQYNRPIPKFSAYAKDLRKIATKTLLLSYLSETLNALPKQENQKTNFISTSERKLVHGRKTWSELVSAMHTNNQVDIEKLNVKQAVIKRLELLGFQNAENLYSRCVHALQENTAIVISFNARFLKNKQSADYHTQNIFERGHNNFSAYSRSYTESRDKTEYNLFKSIDEKLKLAMSSIHSRPKYGKLIFIDRNSPETTGMTSYGQSFIVLKDIVKHCSLFNRRDSMNGQFGNMTPCSYLNLEYLLHQSSNTRLKAIAELVINGTATSPYHNSTSFADPNNEEYIEVLLPSIEFLKSDFVQHIFIHTNEYQLEADDIQVLSLSGIPYSNATISPYQELYHQFIKAQEKHDFALIETMIKQYPLLEKLIGADGNHLMHSAAIRGNLQHVQKLVDLGCSLHIIDSEGRTPFMCAMTTQTPEFILQFATLFPEVTSMSGREDTPLMYATKHASDEIFFAVLTITPVKIINQKNAQGESPLFQAVAAGSQNKVQALLATPEIDYIAMRDPGDKKTAFDLARENKFAIITKLIIAHTIRLRSNNSLSEAEINAKIEYEFSNAILDDMEQLFRFHFSNFGVITNEIQSVIKEFTQLFIKLKSDTPELDIKEKCLAMLNYLTTKRHHLHQLNNTSLLMWKSHSDTTIKLNEAIKAIQSYLKGETTFLNEPNPVSISGIVNRILTSQRN